MTRANLNFLWQNRGEAPRTLFHYHNGDQYPEGLLTFFGIEDFLSIARPWTPDDFRAWIAKNYRVAGRKVGTLPNGMTLDMHCETDVPAEPEDLGEGGQPRVYYTDGFITDYSYLFSVDVFKRGAAANRVLAYNWDRRIFKGSARQFRGYCRRQFEMHPLTPLPQHSEHALKDSVLAQIAGLPTA
jgi:hypothetical protein